MTDFHTHTLPGIDDGSKNAEQSVEMLDALVSIGFSKVLFTPHYYPDDQSISTFLQKRDASYEALMSFASGLKDIRLPSFGFGAEVYLHPLLFNSGDDEIRQLTIDQNGRIMLTGDAASLEDNLRFMLVPGTCTSIGKAEESLQKIQHFEDIGYELFFSHEVTQKLRLFPEYYE